VKDLVFEDKVEDKELEPRPGPTKLKAKTKDIQMPLLQPHITINLGDLNQILNILNVIRI